MNEVFSQMSTDNLVRLELRQMSYSELAQLENEIQNRLNRFDRPDVVEARTGKKVTPINSLVLSSMNPYEKQVEIERLRSLRATVRQVMEETKTINY